MDNMPAIGRPSAGPGAQRNDQESLNSSEDPTPETRTPVRAYGRTGVRRVITRYAFEFYLDQIEDLRRISLEDKLQGERGSMSEMVREAIDQYIAKRKDRVT